MSASTRSISGRSLVSSYMELGKARLSTLVVATTAVGFAVAPGRFDLPLFVATLVGTTLAALGANSLNQWAERERDALMERTRTRPLPSGRMSARDALIAGLLESVVGVATLALLVNTLTAALAAFVILLYVLVYTPLKSRSHLNTMVGAVCGAIPPMMGWTAVTGALDPGAYILAAVLFVWQIPHFLALAWLYREDYQRGGYRMLPHSDPSGRLTAAMALLYSIALIPVTLMGAVGGLAGWVYVVGSVLLGLGMTVLGIALVRTRCDANARRLFFASLLYLPLLLGVMVADQGSLVGGGPTITDETAIERAAPTPTPAPDVADDLQARVLAAHE